MSHAVLDRYRRSAFALANRRLDAYAASMLGWIFGGMAVLLCWGVLSRVRLYQRLLSDAHFLAVANAAPALKRAALSKIIAPEQDAIQSASDPRVLKTDAGLAVLYTVSQQADDFVHHCSLSFPDEHVAQGTRATFLHFVLRCLGLPPERASFGSAGNVQHAQFCLSAAEHAALLALPPLDTSASNLLALRAAAVQGRTPRQR